jgi:DNA-binding NarL/FixJ family response regulator
VPDARARVTVLYSHSLLGEGLARLLAEEPGLEVEAIELSDVEAVQAAIASRPEVIVVEEGGRLDGIDVLRQGGSPVVVDVDIRSMEAWAFHRDPIASRPDSLLEAIREAVGLPSPDPAGDEAGADGADAAAALHHEGPAHLRHSPAPHLAAEGPAPA